MDDDDDNDDDGDGDDANNFGGLRHVKVNPVRLWYWLPWQGFGEQTEVGKSRRHAAKRFNDSDA